jgi:ABC-2 type transport system permease protein
MNPVSSAVRLGFARAWIEFKQYLKNPQEIIWTLIMTIAFVVVLWFQRDKEVEGLSLALLTLPSLLGMLVAQSGFSGVAGQLSFDREDGTLLRAKALPQGMIGYLVSRILYILLVTILTLLVMFVPSLLFVDGLTGIGWSGLLMFLGLFLLGMLATAPWGAVVGSIVKSSNSGWGLTFFGIAVIVAVSGIFYPITALAGWLQVIGQIFPVYWLGLGMRSAFLPDSAVAAELEGSWRTPETLLVLAVWAVIGMALAPRIMRRMTRRATGSDMEARKQQVLQRGY